MRWILMIVLLTACEKAKDPIEPSTPTADDRAQYDQAVGRLVTGHVYGGFGVVSLKPDGSPEHLGEALIWGGTALWSLPCSKGAGIAQSLAQMILDGDGAMIRVDPLGEYAGGREISLDGVLGVLLGISRRIESCGEADLWREPLGALVAFQEANGGRMHPDSAATFYRGFDGVRDHVAWRAGALADRPTDQGLKDVENTATTWAAGVLAAHETGVGSDACFRVNLGLMALLAIETGGRGKTSAKGRDEFCAVTKTMDIPTVDHWCGRQSIVGYLDNYTDDAWEFRHQRCGSWESPDGDGNSSPEVDRLMAMVMAYSWESLQ